MCISNQNEKRWKKIILKSAQHTKRKKKLIFWKQIINNICAIMKFHTQNYWGECVIRILKAKCNNLNLKFLLPINIDMATENVNNFIYK